MNEYESLYERQVRQDEETRRLNDLKFNYMVEMGAIEPQEEEARRQQAQVDILRDKGMESQEGRMVGDVYVAASPFQHLGQLGNAYMARKGNEKTEANRLRIEGLRADSVAKLGNQGSGTSSGTSGGIYGDFPQGADLPMLRRQSGAAIGDDELRAYGSRKKRFPEGGML